MNRKFLPGDRVLVSENFYWAKGAYGTIARPPAEVVALSGDWNDDLTRKEVSALGEATVYWVWFDEPQIDADGCGPYKGGSINEDALTFATEH